MHSSSDDAIGRQPAVPPDLPRSEPEIIPPGAEFRPQSDIGADFYIRRGTRIRVTRPGPLATAAVVAGIAVLGVLGLLMLLGTLLIGAAAAGAVMLLALIARRLRSLARS
jgi:hypothetical protein